MNIKRIIKNVFLKKGSELTHGGQLTKRGR